MIIRIMGLSCKKIAQRALRAERKLKTFQNKNSLYLQRGDNRKASLVKKEKSLVRKANHWQFAATRCTSGLEKRIRRFT